ncbi:MAG: fibronectin type III domain-containing protein [Promethearchaeota archaeon]
MQENSGNAGRAASRESPARRGWYLPWAAVLVVLGVTAVWTFASVYDYFGTSLAGSYAPLAWIIGGAIVCVGVASAGTGAWIVYRVATGRPPDWTRPRKHRQAWTLLDATWHLVLGLVLLAVAFLLVDEFGSEITASTLAMAVTLGITLVGYGASLVASATRVFVVKLRQAGPLRALPGLKVVGVVFLVAFPLAGLYYYFGTYLPDAEMSRPRDRGPVLTWMNDTSTTMTIGWDSVEEGAYVLKWGTSEDALTNEATPTSYTIYAPSSGAWGEGQKIGYHHLVELSGLSPDTTYYYTIPGFTDGATPFKTGPAATKAFSFQVIGDTRRPDTRHRPLVELMATYPADFVVNVGDVCNNAQLDWNQFLYEIRDQANTRPYLVAIGNHEYGDEMGYYLNYHNTPEHYYYSLNYSNVHLLVIDCFDGEGGMVSAAQKAFIEADLRRNAGKHDWTFVAFHVPIFSTGDFNYDPQREWDFMPLFTQYGVDVVLTGHDHHYESFNISRAILESKFGAYGSTGNGMMHFVCGGGGSPLDVAQCLHRSVDPWKDLYHNSSEEVYQQYFPKGATAATANYTVADVQIYGELVWQFMEISVDGKNLNITSVRLDGSVIESFSLTKP